jgi:alkylhydroperoxidase family enzyme
MSKQRIESLQAPYPQEVQDSFDIVMPAGMPPLNIFRTVARNPRVLSRMVRGGLLDKGSISAGDRELVILRACARCGAEYEWGVHVAAFAAHAGFSDEQLADTCQAPVDTSLWSEAQLLLLALVDELHDNAALPDPLWAELAQQFSEEQLVELVMLAGLYHAVSFVVNAFHVEQEEFTPGFPGQGPST